MTIAGIAGTAQSGHWPIEHFFLKIESSFAYLVSTYVIRGEQNEGVILTVSARSTARSAARTSLGNRSGVKVTAAFRGAALGLGGFCVERGMAGFKEFGG